MHVITDFLFSGWLRQLLFASFITIVLAFCAYILGLFVALFFTVCSLLNYCFINKLRDVYTAIFKTMPELLVIIFFFYVFSNFNAKFNTYFSFQINSVIVSFVGAVIALGLISGSYLTEIFRGGKAVISIGQIEACKALGMTSFISIYRVIIPQIISYSYKPIVNIWLITLKDTSLVAIIGISDIMFQTNLAVTTTNQPFIFYTFAIILYLSISFVSLIIFRGIFYKYNFVIKN